MFGDAGIVTLVATIGALDVDAAIVTVGGLPPQSISPGLAGLMIAGTVLLNMILKIIIVALYAGVSRARRALVALLVSGGTLAVVGGLRMMY
jgi:hypothetical protein